MQHKNQHIITGGVYLIADASLEKKELMEKLHQAISGGVTIVQLYNTTDEHLVTISDINEICEFCHLKNVPVMVNNNWALLNDTLLDGVHFDKIPTNFRHVEGLIKKPFIKGITCTNDLDIVRWAIDFKFDYISFCSIFPAKNSVSADVVCHNVVLKARSMTDIPFFVSGGINLDNVSLLSDLPVTGIAMISGIMASPDVINATKKYLFHLDKIISPKGRTEVSD